MPGKNQVFSMEARIGFVRWTRIGRALIPLLVVALLLCRGAFGPVHQLLLVGPGKIAGHPPLLEFPVAQDGTADVDLEDSNYYAVTLLLIVGALLWFRLARAHKFVPIPIVLRAGFRPCPAALGRLRGPTVFVLQVLRL